MRQQRASDQRNWIISPWFDLFFVINLWWLFCFLPQPAAGATQSTSVEFWQVYFLTTPHRWLTLLLVATDPDRRGERTWLFILLAIVAAVAVLSTRMVSGAFNCLILVDYVWNAWHFGSQHGGILRIYSRMGGGGRPWLESTSFRVFVAYVALRTAAWLTGWTEGLPWARNTMLTLDWLVLVAPLLLVALELINEPFKKLGKLLYLTSVISMYTALLMAIRNSQHQLVVPLVVASAAFHAVEYMAIVTFYAWRRRDSGSEAPFRRMARNWLRLLAIYVVCVGMIAEFTNRHLVELYLGLNLWAAYLHYAYDGMIWKLRRPETAKALNVELNSGKTVGQPG